MESKEPSCRKAPSTFLNPRSDDLFLTFMYASSFHLRLYLLGVLVILAYWKTGVNNHHGLDLHAYTRIRFDMHAESAEK